MKIVTQAERIFLCLLVLLDVLAMFFAPLQYPLMIVSLSVLFLGFHHLGSAFRWATGIFFLSIDIYLAATDDKIILIIV